MSYLENLIPKNKLALDYTSAKMIANPYDYTLSDRLILENSIRIYDLYHILQKSYRTEVYLSRLLGLDTSIPYLEVKPDFRLINIPPTPYKDIQRTLDDSNVMLGNFGTFIKYNNLIVNEPILINDVGYLYGTIKPLENPPLIENIHNFKILKALEVWYTLVTQNDSMVPNLIYLLTKFNSYKYDELTNIKFAEDAIANGIAPIFDHQDYKDEGLQASNYLSIMNIPFYNMKGFNPIFYQSFEDTAKFTTDTVTGEECYKLGMFYTLVYGYELLYLLDSIKDSDIKNILINLITNDLKQTQFCSKFLYSNTNGNFTINPEIVSCFDKNPEVRFDNYRTLFEKHTKEFFNNYTPILTNFEYYKMPVFFVRMVQNCHTYAIQNLRLKHVTLLYKKCKSKGLLENNVFEECVNEDCFLSELGESTGYSNELLDVFSADGPACAQESLDDEKQSKTETAPKLAAIDALKKSLNESKYTYDITYKTTADDKAKEAYNIIAKNIKMITKDLTKHIKDIKTYNTGGKQNGLSRGKLDKTNLWKYKSTHTVFYNNNYKLKEMDLAFGCILDESGSMSGDKIQNGKIVMVMLHEVLSALGINHSIIGHDSNENYKCNIAKYYQFKEEPHYSLEKPYGIVSAHARTCNCDSGVLYYMQNLMKSVRNKDKIVIIFSDGQPTHCTDLELTQQVKTMEKEGIHVIGVGIDFESIKTYYPDNANGKNLKGMVDIVVSILKRYVLEKKEE